jgi:type II secretory pathway pseudopilin PulG
MPAARRSTLWISALLVVASLLAVVLGDAMVNQSEIRLTNEQGQLAAALTAQKALQVAVAEKSAPPVVVAQAKAQGLIAPTTVDDLPRVPLDVPLPPPQTAPLHAS